MNDDIRDAIFYGLLNCVLGLLGGIAGFVVVVLTARILYPR